MNKNIKSVTSYSADYSTFNTVGKKDITLNNNGQKITGIILRSVLGDYHEIITKDNKITRIAYDQNSGVLNQYIFYKYL